MVLAENNGIRRRCGNKFKITGIERMNLFGFELRKIKNDVKKRPVSKYTSGGLFYYSPRMTTAQLLANSTVNACVNIIADAVACLSLNVYKKGENGREKVQDISLAKLLKNCPNYDDTPYSFKQQIMLHLLLKGNAFIFIERNWDYTVRSLTALDPDYVEICRDDSKDVYYKFSVDGHIYKCNSETILHIPAIRYNRLRGLSPLEYSTNCAKIGLDLDEYTQKYFDGGIHSKLLVNVPVEQKNWSKEDSQKLTEQLLASYGGKENANKPLILSKGLTASPVNINGNSDSQLVENRKFSEKEIAKIFRVPLFMLGSENSKFTNQEQANTYFLQHTLTPWLVKIQEYFNRLLPYDLKETCYVEFDTDTMLRADYNTRMNNYVKGLQSGIYTLNQVLEMENLPKVKEDYADKHIMLENYKAMDGADKDDNDEDEKDDNKDGNKEE